MLRVNEKKEGNFGARVIIGQGPPQSPDGFMKWPRTRKHAIETLLLKVLKVKKEKKKPIS